MMKILTKESTAVKKGEEDSYQFISGCWVNPSGEYITLKEYKRIMDIGGEYGFIYDGHGYFTSGFGHPEAWEWNNDESYQEGFKDIDDMLDNYHLHTGETLREIIPKSMLELPVFVPYYTPLLFTVSHLIVFSLIIDFSER